MESLPARIVSLVLGKSDEDFETLIRDLFAYQYAHNAPYRRLCDYAGMTPETVENWTEVPAVPAQAFRRFDLSCIPIASTAAVFFSSGTTADRSSKHWFSDESLELYEISLRTNYYSRFSRRDRLFAVMPHPLDAPHSSLSHMLGALDAEEFAGNDLTDFRIRLMAATEDSRPITLFGTAFGLMEMLSLGSVQLPVGSRVIETGGFKGRYRELPRDEFYHLLRDGLSVADSHCFSEYGMCELTSQFYSQGEAGSFSGPRWIRTRCIDPITGRDAKSGSYGLLRHYDLTNLNSVGVLQTQDRAVIDDDGNFSLHGRAADAELRGCSLTAEELWSRS